MKLVQIVVNETRGTVHVLYGRGIVLPKPEQQAMRINQIIEREAKTVYVWWILGAQ